MKGFTLVESIFATSIFLVLVLVVYTLMNAGSNAWFGSEASVGLRKEIIKTFTAMEKELKNTKPSQISLGAGAASGTLTFKVPQDRDADGTVLDATGNIEWSDNITYALNGSGQITRTIGAATTILANNITSLQFTRPETSLNLLQVDINAERLSMTRRTMRDAGQVTIKMRN